MDVLFVSQVGLGATALCMLVYLWRTHDEDNRYSIGRAMLFGCVFVALLSVWSLPLVALATVGTNSPAKVVALECPKGEKHYVHFEYSVDSRTFTGTALASEIPGACESLKIGTMGSVVYLPSAPKVSAWGSPWPSLQFNLLLSGFALVAFPVIARWHKVRAR